MGRETVISAHAVGKRYRLGELGVGYGRLAEAITERFTRVRAASKHDRPEIWALRDVDFEVARGEAVGIIGHNGAGKSTLLKILSRITPPTAGEIRLRGRVGALLEVGTGFHPELTGRENIYLNGAVLGMRKAEITARFDEIVAFAEVEQFIDTPVKRYSTGMRLRLAFAVAAHLEPEILIVDEVLSVGDLAFQERCLGRMNAVAAEGRTILFVSHNLIAVKNFCHRCMLLSEGRKVVEGSPEGVIQTYIESVRSESAAGRAAEGRSNGVVADHPDVRVSSYRIHDSAGMRKRTFMTTEPIQVTIEYALKRSLPGLRVGIDLISMADGEVIFRTFDDDLAERKRSEGTYSARCTIPSNLLMPGPYAVSLQIGLHNLRWITNGEVIEQIDVENVDGVNSLYGDRRPGRIMPAVSWNEE